MMFDTGEGRTKYGKFGIEGEGGRVKVTFLR